MTSPDYTATLSRFTGFGAAYDQARPTAPAALAELLCNIAGCAEPELVVDLGSGTGLSTRYWVSRAKEVIGIEPTDSMRQQAEGVKGGGAGEGKISYRKAFAQATGLPDACADVVTCAQSLHWMEPGATFAEAARLLREGGVFAAYDYDWPPCTSSWQVDKAYTECMAHGRRLEREHGLTQKLAQWEKEGHLERMQNSGCFRYTRECLLHHEDSGDAERLIGLLLSQGYIQSLLKVGLSEKDLQIDRLREVVASAFGSASQPWFWSVRIRLGVR